MAARLALVFAATMAPVLQHFRPGAIDHHNVQLALLVWSLAFATRQPARARDAGTAGAMAALSLAIGQELAPPMAALAAIVTVRWIAGGAPVRAAAAAFGIAFAGVMFALFLATVPPARYLVTACDTLSLVQVVTATLGGSAWRCWSPRLASRQYRAGWPGPERSRPSSLQRLRLVSPPASAIPTAISIRG